MKDTYQILVDFVVQKINERIFETATPSEALRKSISPEDLKKRIDFKISNSSVSENQLLELIKEVVDYSVNTHHPYFMNQMFGKTQPVAFLADILISILNTSMYTYEVAPALTLIEKETIAHLTSMIWGKGQGDGVLTSGGSLSNMKAMLLARQNLFHQVKNKGLFTEKPVAIFVSEQAHYSFTKGVNFMGFGTEALIKIKSDSQARIDVNDLHQQIEKSIEQGRIPMLLVGIAGTTISATYDPIEELAAIAKSHGMWFHVDAAFGGALLFSDQEKHKLKGIEKADSVTWNFHKAMGMPLSTSTFLTKEKGKLNAAFQVDADYLFHHKEDDYDLGQKSLQGGRRPDVLKLWLSLKFEGNDGFTNRIETLRKKSLFLSQYIQNQPELELFQQPEATIVCFRFFSNDFSNEELNQINTKIREQIFEEGKMIFNYAPLHDKIYLRCVILDPDFSELHLKNIVDTVLEKAKSIIKTEKV